MADQKGSHDAGAAFDLVVEVRGVEQGNRPVSVSFPGISVGVGSASAGFATFEGPYDVYSPPGSKAIDVAVEAPIFVGLMAHAFGPAEGLWGTYEGAGLPTIWELAGFEITSTFTTRFFGYKAGSNRSPKQVGLSQLIGRMRGSPHGATHVTSNMHFWSAPDFALTFQDARVTIRPAGYGRLALSAEYSWNDGEWTAKTHGLLTLDGNPLVQGAKGSELSTVMTVNVEERDSDKANGILAGT